MPDARSTSAVVALFEADDADGVLAALAGVLDRQRLAEVAAAAAEDVRMGRNHRSWYRSIPRLLVDPSLLPGEADHGPPPPGNRLHRPG